MNEEKQLTIKIPEDIHSELKLLAVVKKTTMKDIILECIQLQIEKFKEETKK